MKIYIAITYALFAALWLSTATSADEFDRERRSIFEDGGVPELVAEKNAGEGPAWHAELGLVFSGDGNVNRRDRQGTVSVYIPGAQTNGLMFDPQGNLVACQPGMRRVVRFAKGNTSNPKVLADQFDGKRFNQPNDLTLDSKGRIFFTDPQYGDRSTMEMRDAQGKLVEGVYRIDPDGKVSRIIAHEVDRPNGIVVTPDDKYLFVADNNNNEVGGARKLWRFAFRADGEINLESRTLVYDWKTTRGPDGMKLDVDGKLFVAAGLNKPNLPAETADPASAGVYVFSQDGKLLTMVPIPRDEVTNVAFGNDDRKSLFVTAGGTLWRLRVRQPGYVRK